MFSLQARRLTTLTDIRQLLDQFAEGENELLSTQFLAPCVRHGRVRTRVAGMVYTFVPQPRTFEGWGIFQPQDAKTAALVEPADFIATDAYLEQFPKLSLRLAYPLQHGTWLAYPVNEGDMRQRWGRVKPIPLHLVEDGASFEQIIGRWDGRSWWFQMRDRRADPTLVEALEAALKQFVPPRKLHFPHLTPEMRSLYELVAARTEGFSPHQRDQRRLQQALTTGGGQLQRFSDAGDYWRVEWTTADGQRHTSAISKSDLTVMSAGICLSGRDRDFDLQSLVGVVEGWDD